MNRLDAIGLRDVVDRARIVVCCGSGGVGKTTTAAAIAWRAAESGRRVVLITIDPARRLADALGMSGALDNEPSQLSIDGTGELWAMMLDARQTFDDVVREQARTPRQAERILENPFYRNIASRLSGSQEYMAAEKLYALHHDDRFDLVVVDTPPSREALDFLEAPQKLMNFLDHRVYRWLIAPARGGLKVLNIAAQPILRTIGRVIGADVLADAIDFFQAFEGIEDGFRRRAAKVQELLRSDDTHYVVVASPRVDTIDEAIFFSDRLGESSIAVSGLVVNRVQPTFGRGSAASALQNERRAERDGDEARASLHRNLHEIRSIAEAEETGIERLVVAVDAESVVRVPQRVDDVHDADAIAEMGRLIIG